MRRANLSEYIPVMVELRNGTRMTRGLRDLEHNTICRAFSLDECSTWFDVPSTFYGVGSNRGMTSSTARRDISGYIFQGPKGSDPVGKIRLTYEGDKFSNEYAESNSDFYNLGR